MLATRNPQTLDDPVGIEAAIEEINALLKAQLPWLDIAYGKCEKLLESKEKGSYPAIYSANNEYVELFPDQNKGNFSFFDIAENSVINWVPHQLTGGSAEFGLIVWFDYRKVYPADSENKSIEHVKLDVLTVLNTIGLLNSTITCHRVLERVENVYNGYNLALYRGFSYGNIKSPYMMRPYGVFRIEGKINYRKNC